MEMCMRVPPLGWCHMRHLRLISILNHQLILMGVAQDVYRTAESDDTHTENMIILLCH